MLFVAAFCLLIQGVAAAEIDNNKWDIKTIDNLIKQAEISHGIPKGLLAAIAETESGSRVFAVNLSGRSVYVNSMEKAVALTKQYINSGEQNIDIGIMQLNYRWHKNNFANVKEMLTPEINIKYAAKLVKSLYDQHGSWQEAIRHYHCAKSKHNRKYSRKVALAWLKSEN